ncbi:MAG: NAD-dependent epimerase/dehydratase family protein [Deltaproteobacteria bacterium]|nr:NAD-dependent epimerase/dehydratase family protein [Deltaproteobacteria bacterium]
MTMILITGASGQIGTDLTLELRRRYGDRNVVATDVRHPRNPEMEQGLYEFLDVMDPEGLRLLIEQYNVDTIFHLAAILSAVAERTPVRAWQVNTWGTVNVLDTVRRTQVSRVFVPSSIAAFGPTTPLDKTPQDTIQRPNAMYGITKVATELLGDYYYEKFGVDCRGVRLPGIISYKTPPGGGTTDYAIDMIAHAVRHEPYVCYLRADTSLDMMYMPDALHACIGVMEADGAKLRHRNAFNVTAMQFTPEQLAEKLTSHFPDFQWSIEVDPIRQAIADSWPNSMDDSAARKEWDWTPKYDLSAMTADMIEHVSKQIHDE